MTALQKVTGVGFSQNTRHNIQKTLWSKLKRWLKLRFDATYLLQKKNHRPVVCNTHKDPNIYSVKNKKSGKNTGALSAFWGGMLPNNLWHYFPFPMPGICAQNLHFEALWSLSECVWTESAETLLKHHLPLPAPSSADSCGTAPSPLGTWTWLQRGANLHGCERLWDHLCAFLQLCFLCLGTP